MRLSLILFTALFLFGCWSDFRQKYYKYVDPPPTILLETEKATPQERALALAVTPIDQRITALSRFLAVYDKVNYEEWLRALATQFPWVQGAGIISESGGVLFANPAGLFNRVSFERLIQIQPTTIKLQQKAMFEPVGNQDAFLFIAQPVFSGEDLSEYRVVAVALSALSAFSEEADNLYFIGDNKVLWRGKSTKTDSLAVTTNWTKVETTTVSGLLSNKNSALEYIVIYIGPVPFVIALDVPKA